MAIGQRIANAIEQPFLFPDFASQRVKSHTINFHTAFAACKRVDLIGFLLHLLQSSEALQSPVLLFQCDDGLLRAPQSHR